MFGQKIRLVTTQNTYLSISGFEAYTASAPAGWTMSGGSTRRTMRTTSTSRQFRRPPMMKTGGWGMGGMTRRAVPFKLSFSMGSTKVSLN
jgi:hypothetical protein